MASIVLQRVEKVYANGHAAVRGLTLAIDDGELLVLVGPSGSGKSTVLRLVAGLETPTAGEVIIGGRDVTRLPPQGRDLAMVFQSYALYPHKTVRENMAFGLRVRRIPAAEIDARVRHAAATLGIEELLGRRPAELSGGQRQRVALGRAIVREPDAFLLDEPLSNLDPLLRVDTRAELALLHRRLRATMVYVTHDQGEAMTLGTRIAVMRNGTLEQVGAPLEVYRRPANTFVASFIGSPAMNLWAGAVADRPVTLGVRPHELEIGPADDADLRGRVVLVEPLGAETVVHVRLDDPADLTMRVVAPGDRAAAFDERVGLRYHRDRLHVFERQSGVRLDI